MQLTEAQSRYLTEKFKAIFADPTNISLGELGRIFTDVVWYDDAINDLLYACHQNITNEEDFRHWAFDYLKTCFKFFYGDFKEFALPDCIQSCFSIVLSTFDLKTQESIISAIAASYIFSLCEALSELTAYEFSKENSIQKFLFYIKYIHKKDMKDIFNCWAVINFEEFLKEYKRVITSPECTIFVAEKDLDDPRCIVSVIKDEAIRLQKQNDKNSIRASSKINQKLMEMFCYLQGNKMLLTNSRRLLLEMLPWLWEMDKAAYFNVLQFAVNEILIVIVGYKPIKSKIRLAAPYATFPALWKTIPVNNSQYEDWDLIKQQDEDLKEHLQLAYNNTMEDSEKEKLQILALSVEIILDPSHLCNIYCTWLQKVKCVIDEYHSGFIQVTSAWDYMEKNRLWYNQARWVLPTVLEMQHFIKEILSTVTVCSNLQSLKLTLWYVFKFSADIKKISEENGGVYNEIMQVFPIGAIRFLCGDFYLAAENLQLLTQKIPTERDRSMIIGLLSEIKNDPYDTDLLWVQLQRMIKKINSAKSALLYSLSSDDLCQQVEVVMQTIQDYMPPMDDQAQSDASITSLIHSQCDPRNGIYQSMQTQQETDTNDAVFPKNGFY